MSWIKYAWFQYIIGISNFNESGHTPSCIIHMNKCSHIFRLQSAPECMILHLNCKQNKKFNTRASFQIEPITTIFSHFAITIHSTITWLKRSTQRENRRSMNSIVSIEKCHRLSTTQNRLIVFIPRTSRPGSLPLLGTARRPPSSLPASSGGPPHVVQQYTRTEPETECCSTMTAPEPPLPPGGIVPSITNAIPRARCWRWTDCSSALLHTPSCVHCRHVTNGRPSQAQRESTADVGPTKSSTTKNIDSVVRCY